MNRFEKIAGGAGKFIDTAVDTVRNVQSKTGLNISGGNLIKTFDTPKIGNRPTSLSLSVNPAQKSIGAKFTASI